MNDCDACKAATPREARRLIGCGWEQPHELAVGWDHKGRKSTPPTSCIGYARHLPELIEVVRARSHWDKGQLEAFCGGECSENALTLIEILEGSAREAESWMMTPAAKGGGAE